MGSLARASASSGSKGIVYAWVREELERCLEAISKVLGDLAMISLLILGARAAL